MFSVSDELLTNLTSLIVVFLYMFKDVSAVIQATLYYLKRIENASHTGHDLNFYQYRVLIALNLAQYACLLLYAIFEMNQVHSILVKLEVALEIFFMLEVDDWAYSLFFADNDFLDDADFDVHMPFEVGAKDRQKQREKRLWISLVVVFGAMFAMVVSSKE